MTGRDAIEYFYKKYNFKLSNVVCVNIFVKLKNKPVFNGNCKIVIKENYRMECLEIDCLDESLQKMKFGSSWNTANHNISIKDNELIIIDAKNDTKIIIKA